MFPGVVGRLYDEARSRQRHRKLNLVFTSMIPWITEKPWVFAYDKVRNSFLATEEIHFIGHVLRPVLLLGARAGHEHRPGRREARIAVNDSLTGGLIDWAVPVDYARDSNQSLCSDGEQAHGFARAQELIFSIQPSLY